MMIEEAFQDLAEHIEESLEGAIERHEFSRGELILLAKREEIVRVLQFLRDDKECDFDTLIDLCGVDYPERENRFDVVYMLLSTTQNQRVRVKLEASEDTAVPSVEGIYSTAGWLERETWDMYGVYFDGNKDLRRILTDYGFEGHPQRKDFPLTGYVELRYDEELRRVVYEPVQLVQDFRNFDSISPWEGMTEIQVPGEEKGTKPKFGWFGARKKEKAS